MSPQLACLLDDLRKVIVPTCADLTADEANELYHALQGACITIDCARVLKGNLDWMDERSRRLGGLSK